MSEQNNNHDRDALLFLSCHDVFERLDTLILEIRHIQKNIIYLLRTPELYQPLVKEEPFVWHFSKKELWLVDGDGLAKYADLVRSQFVYYPEPLSEFSARNESGEDIQELEKRLSGLVRKMFLHGIWNNDQRVHYRNLFALQHIKANIVRDKIYLCNKMADFFLTPGAAKVPEQKASERRARLLMLRSVMLARAREYVARVGDHQEVLARAEDYGLQDHPSPNFNRRRDQHLR